ncbi:hypothetical protein GCM10023192_46310 [Amycolatopsis samaneae]
MILGMAKKTWIIIGVIAAVVIIYALNKQSADASSTTGCKVGVTADVLNVREAPDGNAKIVGKYVKDAKVDVLPGAQNGFRKISDTKWVSAEFTKPEQGAKC